MLTRNKFDLEWEQQPLQQELLPQLLRPLFQPQQVEVLVVLLEISQISPEAVEVVLLHLLQLLAVEEDMRRWLQP